MPKPKRAWLEPIAVEGDGRVYEEQIGRLITMARERGYQWHPLPGPGEMFFFALDLLAEVHPNFKVLGRRPPGRKRGVAPKWTTVEQMFLLTQVAYARSKLGMTKEQALEHVRVLHYPSMSENNRKGKGSLYERLKLTIARIEQDPGLFWADLQAEVGQIDRPN